MLAHLKITEYLHETAAGSPTPGGGSVAALSAALAAGLTEMVANLTIGKKGYETVQAEMREIAGEAAALRNKLTQDIDKDPDSYKEVIAAFQLSKNTEEEKNKRSDAIEQGLKNAALVPLGVARDTLKITALAATVIKKGSKSAVTDGVVGAMTARTAGLAALLNVRINLSSIKDEKFVEELTQEVEDLEGRLVEEEKAILAQVEF